MTEEPESTDKPEADAEATTHIRRAKRQPPNWTQLRERGAGILAAVLRWVGLVFAVILVAHIILVIGEANPDNWITMTVADLAGPLSIGFQDLFIIADQKLELLVNYGLAAIFWLVVSAIAARIVRRLGGSSL
ncbi:hypothetical protein EV191_103252 [Tamaricihabitans halophyticus]|uniref:YGGT family protein n=2 Tax=Tamaricihabitans halophyticus TaxID=1262583 RepID=A0A4R2QYD9_9PSEU|nr:hypothetical protein EV191_103252 [Tamaricihabitans halophyticus]